MQTPLRKEPGRATEEMDGWMDGHKPRVRTKTSILKGVNR